MPKNFVCCSLHARSELVLKTVCVWTVPQLFDVAVPFAYSEHWPAECCIHGNSLDDRLMWVLQEGTEDSDLMTISHKIHFHGN